MNCAECSHYHNLGDKLMCDAGLMEVTMVGNPQVVVKMPQCEKFEQQKSFLCHDHSGYTNFGLAPGKPDRRTKEYKEKNKLE